MNDVLTGPVTRGTLAAALRTLATGRRSGTLTVRGSRGSKKIFFYDGQVLAVASAEAGERLGHYLVGWGHVTPSQLDELLERQRSEARGLGELAVARRLLDAEEMKRMLRIRAEDALFDLLRWDEGAFRFAPGLSPVRGYVELRLEVVRFLEHVEELMSVWRRLEQRVPDARDIPRVVPISQFATLSMAEAAILRQVDGQRTLGQVALMCRVSQLEVVTVLQIHAREGLVSFITAAGRSAATATPWQELLREAEHSVSFGDLAEAYDRLCQALTAWDTTRSALDEALAVEATIRSRLGFAPETVLAPAAGPGLAADPRLNAEEAAVLARVDRPRPVADVLAELPGDRLRVEVVVHGLLQHGFLVAVAG